MKGGGKGGSQGGKGAPGPPKELHVECKHASMVSNIANGVFALLGENHGKPTYKKNEKVSGLDILIYFWDERDGADQCGWYLGPEIGGNQVWAYAATKGTIPPYTGWQVPYGGSLDPTFIIKAAAASPAAPVNSNSNGTPAGQSPPPQQMQPPQQQPPQQQQQQKEGLLQKFQQQAQRWAQNKQQQEQQQQQQPQQQEEWSQQDQSQQQWSQWEQQKQPVKVPPKMVPPKIEASAPQQGQQWKNQEWFEENSKRLRELEAKEKQQTQGSGDQAPTSGLTPLQEQFKQKQQDEIKKRQEEWNKRQAELRAKMEAMKKQKDDQKKQQEEEEKKKKEEEQVKKQEEQEKKKEEIRQRQEEWKRKAEERKKFQEELKRKAEEHKKKTEEEKKKKEAEQKIKDEERRLKEEEDKKRKQEESKKRQEERKQLMEIQKKKHMEDWARKKEELAKKKEEEQKKQEEINRIKAEEEEKKQQELKKKREEEMKKKQEEDAVKQAERTAATNIRRAIQKVRMPTPENFEEAKQELEEAVKKDLEKTGSMQKTITEECEKAREQGQKHVEQVVENRKKQEARKVEEEKKRKAALEIATKLVGEFDGMVQKAEGKGAEVEDAMKRITNFNPADDLSSLSTKVDALSAEMKQLLQLNSDFTKEHSTKIRDPILEKAEPEGKEVKQKFAKLVKRLAEAKKKFEGVASSGETALGQARKRKRAQDKTDELMGKFQKYAKKSKGILNKQEAVAYAKAEFKFDLPQAALTAFWATLDAEGDAGVKFESFPLLKMAIGIAREKARDFRKAEERVEQERVFTNVKENMVKQVQETSKLMLAALEKVKVAETQVKKLALIANLAKPVADMMQLADETDKIIESAQEPVEAALMHLDKLVEGVDKRFEKDVQGILRKEASSVITRLSLLDKRVQRTRQITKHFRENASRKEERESLEQAEKIARAELEAADKIAMEFETLYAKTLTLLRYNQKLKKVDNEGLFRLMDTKADDVIDEAEWLAFFASADTEVKELVETKAADDKGKESAADTGKEAGDKSASTDDAKEKIDLTPSELSRIFAYIDDEGKGKISKDVFVQYIRFVMRVVRATIMGSDVSLKKSKNVRKVEANEVMEVLQGPVPEPDVKVQRIQAKALKDGSEGWISVAGNQGTVFLAEGQQLYYVVDDTDLTDAFELEPEAKPKLRLTAGMRLEVLESPKKEAKSGLMRMKGKVRGNGSIGWATTTGCLQPL